MPVRLLAVINLWGFWILPESMEIFTYAKWWENWFVSMFHWMLCNWYHLLLALAHAFSLNSNNRKQTMPRHALSLNSARWPFYARHIANEIENGGTSTNCSELLKHWKMYLLSFHFHMKATNNTLENVQLRVCQWSCFMRHNFSYNLSHTQIKIGWLQFWWIFFLVGTEFPPKRQ